MAYSEKYDALARRIAAEEFPDDPQLEGIFYRMIKQESGFDADVVEGRRSSSAGAQGIAQFMPATARGRNIDPFNPEEALRGAAAYLREGIGYFGGDVAKGVASYNAGAGGVEQAVAAGGAKWTASLPAETQSYLQIVQPGTAFSRGMQGVGEGIAAGQAAGQAAAGEENWAEFLVRKGFLSKYTDPNTGEATYLETSPMTADIENQLWAEFTGKAAEAEPTVPVSSALDATFRWLDAQVAAGAIDPQNASDQFIRAAEKERLEQGRLSEAGQRAQQVQGILEKRAMRTLPGKYVPGTRPTDILAQSMASRGRTFEPEEGVPLSSLPDPWELFRQANLSVGLPGELEPLNLPEVPPTPNIYAQQLPAYEDVATRMWEGAGLGGAATSGVGGWDPARGMNLPGGYIEPFTPPAEPMAAAAGWQGAWERKQAAQEAAPLPEGQAAFEQFRAGAASVPVPPPPPQAGALPNDWLRKYLASIGIQLPRLA